MPRRSKYKRKPTIKPPVLKRDRFNGLAVIEEPGDIAMFTQWSYLIDSFYSSIYRSASTLGTSVKCEDLTMLSNGMLRIDNTVAQSRDVLANPNYTLVKSALVQLISFLRIPLSFAKRIQPTLLVSTVNSILEQMRGHTVRIKYGPENTVVGVFADNRERLSVVNILEEFAEFALHSGRTRFHFALCENSTTLVTLELGSYPKASNVSGGLELLLSDAGTVRPTLSGYILSADGLSRIEELTLKLDDELEESDICGQVAKVFDSWSETIAEYVSAFDSMGTIKPTKEQARSLMVSSSKALKKPLSIKEGETFKDVYLSLKALRSGTKTIKQKRELATFAGKVLAMAKLSLSLQPV